MEQELVDLINEWEQQAGKDFLVDGVRFIDYIQNQWAVYQTEKEKAKEMRVCSPQLAPSIGYEPLNRVCLSAV